LRQKVSSKFIPKLNLVKTNGKDKENTEKPMSIKRLPPLILAKSPKEVNEISKFFKNNPTNGNKDIRKSYIQALFSSNNTRKVLQMNYSLGVILELNGISEVQYKRIMIIGDEQYQ